MRVLVDGMPKVKGGIGSLLLNFAVYSKQSSDENEVEFEFLLPESSEYQKDLDKLGCNYYFVPSIMDVANYKFAIKKVFQEKKYDYLWINNTSKVNRFLPVYAAKQGTELILHPHGVDDEEQGIKKQVFRFLNKINYSKYLQLMKYPFACSEAAARSYYQDESIVRQTTIINNGIFADKFTFSKKKREDIRAKLSVKKDDVIIGTVGRLSPVKNHLFLVDLLTILPDNYLCVILGDGEERANLETMAKDNGVNERLLLLGQVENVNEYLNAFDVFVLPSLHEGMPYAVIEAQASGLPCVVSNTVSREVGLSDLVVFAKLNDKIEWMDKILEIGSGTEGRKRYSSVIKDSGYSIEESYASFLRTIAGE